MSKPNAPTSEAVMDLPTARPLALAVALLTGALVLLWWLDPSRLPLPLCAFHTATGLHCPGCGATRATHELLHGRVLSALQHNALWVALLPLVVYAAVSEARRFAHGRPLPGDLLRKPRFLVAVVAIAAIFGLLRNLPAYPFTLLVPPG